MIYDAIIVTFDIIFLFVKFWFRVLFEVYEECIKKERVVSSDIVLITGTGHGIGKELALQYSALGTTVICWDINEQLNMETVQLIKSKGGKAHGYTVDVTNREKVLETGNKVLTEVGTVTILVNNAGIMPQHELLKHTEGEIRKVFEINTIAHFWTLQAFLPTMIEQNCGHIVAISSIAGIFGFKNVVPYCGSKFAVRGMMVALAEELRLHSNGTSKIKFTTVYPYMVDTGLCKRPAIRFKNFMKLLKPHEVAAAIISAQRRGVIELTLPRYLLFLNSFLRNFSANAANLVLDFFGCGVETDM